MNKADCLFCNIVNKKRKEKIVYEDETFIAFPDAKPSAPVHLLIIPKNHVGITGCDIEGRCDVSCKIFDVARKIADKMGISDSYKLLLNAGYSASEAPDHLHVHLVGGWETPTEVESI
jgi:histidine triad (HIT) family protein